MTTELVPAEQERDRRRSLALMKAVGLDRLVPEQRELAIEIAKRYELDLLLKHLVMIEGRPYITRDGLLHIAHRSQQLDGISVTEPVIREFEGLGQFWYSEATVYRKDMSHPFTYGGRYPTKGGNQKFAPEMAVKVGEVMTLRRAFNVALPTVEERWDIEQPEPVRQPSLAERVQARRAEVTAASEDVGTSSDAAQGEAVEPPPAASPPSSGGPVLARSLNGDVQGRRDDPGAGSPDPMPEPEDSAPSGSGALWSAEEVDEAIEGAAR